MLKINGKTFMNIQEAVQWLLDNNALPFQSTANYIGNTEIGMGTIVNPSPAKVRIGSLIFFADSKVSTVIGLTENGFICSDEYNNLVDDVPYVTNVAINGSGHLITTLSNGQVIDAGIIKQVSSFSINASQHLIVTYNDGTSTDLGAIFSGDITISGDLTVTGTVDGALVTGNAIIEKMAGYTMEVRDTTTNLSLTNIYSSVVKNGNKLTIVFFCKINRSGTVTDGYLDTKLSVGIPSAVGTKLHPYTIGGLPYVLSNDKVEVYKAYDSSISRNVVCFKYSDTSIYFNIYGINDLDLNTDYLFRIEKTFLLSENLVS